MHYESLSESLSEPPTKKAKSYCEHDTYEFVDSMKSKNTVRKTKSDVTNFTDFIASKQLISIEPKVLEKIYIDINKYINIKKNVYILTPLRTRTLYSEIHK
jgi:hypothetical protein